MLEKWGSVWGRGGHGFRMAKLYTDAPSLKKVSPEQG